MSSLTIIYASTSGHTEYVIAQLVEAMQKKGLKDALVIRAESATEADVTNASALLLASATWNTGGIEGQLNPHMHTLLRKTLKDTKLGGKPCAIIALGDDRYRYTANAQHHLRTFVDEHKGNLVCDPLVIVNEPYGQEDAVKEWAAQLVAFLVTHS